MAQPYPRAALPQIDALLPTTAAADLLGLKVQTLRKWRVTGAGPRYVRLGGRVAYRRADVDAWIADRTFTSTAAETVARTPT